METISKMNNRHIMETTKRKITKLNETNKGK